MRSDSGCVSVDLIEKCSGRWLRLGLHRKEALCHNGCHNALERDVVALRLTIGGARERGGMARVGKLNLVGIQKDGTVEDRVECGTAGELRIGAAR